MALAETEAEGRGLRIAFSLTGSNWRIADGIGRTTVFPSATVRKLFDYVAPVDLPDKEDRANQ
ncbi:hypothetical protein [Microvirga sp. G4-2]|uniref:hypothetical protein n=1 Tax=Microvirga sp. G4-2 TaxID=3434467 RepID=UPI0040440981